jgi:hypothetical protein
MNKPCEYCGCDLPLGADKKTRQQRSHHFATCKARPAPEVKPFAQRTWVGLTNNELQPIADEYRILFGSWVEDFARAIEAKLRSKNDL